MPIQSEPEEEDAKPNFSESNRLQNAAPAPQEALAENDGTPQPPNVVYVSEQTSKPTADPGFNANTFLALVDNAADKADLAVAAYQTLARAADARVQASRRSARVAWGAVALMGLGVSIAVGWTAHHLTQSTMTTHSLEQQMSATSATLQEVSKERESLRIDMLTTREKAARAEGKLEAATQIQARLEAEVREAKATAQRSSARSTTTKPSIFQRLSSIWSAH